MSNREYRYGYDKDCEWDGTDPEYPLMRFRIPYISGVHAEKRRHERQWKEYYSHCSKDKYGSFVAILIRFNPADMLARAWKLEFAGRKGG